LSLFEFKLFDPQVLRGSDPLLNEPSGELGQLMEHQGERRRASGGHDESECGSASRN
jgi:hypothetical protein